MDQAALAAIRSEKIIYMPQRSMYPRARHTGAPIGWAAIRMRIPDEPATAAMSLLATRIPLGAGRRESGATLSANLVRLFCICFSNWRTVGRRLRTWIAVRPWWQPGGREDFVRWRELMDSYANTALDNSLCDRVTR